MNSFVSKIVITVLGSLFVAFVLASMNIFARVSSVEFKEKVLEEKLEDIKKDTGTLLCMALGEKSECNKR